MLEDICRLPNGYRSIWGYYNRNDFPVSLSVGSKNKFTGLGDKFLGQPLEFQPGRQVRVFSIDWVGHPTNLVWSLDGRTSTAGTGAADEACPDAGLIDSDGDGVPDAVEEISGTSNSDPNEAPAIASSYVNHPEMDQTIFYDFSNQILLGDYRHVRVFIPKGTMTGTFNPIIRHFEQRPENLQIDPPFPQGYNLYCYWRIDAPIAEGKGIDFPLPLFDQLYDASNAYELNDFWLLHYDEVTQTFENQSLDSLVDNQLLYTYLVENQIFPQAVTQFFQRQADEVLANTRIFVDYNGRTVQDLNGMILSNAAIEDAMSQGMRLWESILPEMRFEFVPTQANSNFRFRWVPPFGGPTAISFFPSHNIFPPLYTFNDIHNVPSNPPADSTNSIFFNANERFATGGNRFITREETYASFNEFHNANLVTNGLSLTSVTLHEFGHSLGINLHPIGLTNFVGNPAGIPATWACRTSALPFPPFQVAPNCRDLDRERETTMNDAQLYSQYNNRLIRAFDVRLLANYANPGMGRYTISYPHTHRVIRLCNTNDGNTCNEYRTTTDWYSARYMMFETPNALADRFFVQTLDSIMVGTLAGDGVSGDRDGQAMAARFAGPTSGAVLEDGTIVIADSENHKIKMLTPDGMVSTFAGTGMAGYNDGPGNQAQFVLPAQVAVDPAGNIYTVEHGGHRVRRISPTGEVSTIAGSTAGMPGYVDGNGTDARFDFPASIVYEQSTGDLYVADRNNHVIRRIEPNGDVTTVAGTNSAGYVDAAGAAARFDEPSGMALDENSMPHVLYLADQNNFRIRAIAMNDYSVTTLAGDGTNGYLNGNGPAARLGVISDLTIDREGNLVLADFSNNAVRQINPAMEVTTLAGMPGDPELFRDGAGTDARFNTPNDVIADRSGNIVVSEFNGNRIRAVEKTPRIEVNGSQIGGRIELAGGEDWLVFDVWQAEEHIISINAGSLNDPRVELYGPNTPQTAVLAADDNGGAGNSAQITRELQPGRYYMRVLSAGGTPMGSFTARVVSESLELTAGAAATLGRIEFPGDNAWFEYEQTAVSNVTFEITAAPDLSNAIHLYIYDAGASVQPIPVALEGESTGVGLGMVTLNNLAVGRYWIRVRAENYEDMGNFSIRAIP